MPTLESTLDPQELLWVEQTLDSADVKKKKWMGVIEEMVGQGHTLNDIKHKLNYPKKSDDVKMWLDDKIDRAMYKDAV